MLKVAFWSAIREKGGVTSNMLATAFAICQNYPLSIGIRSNHISNRMLEYYLSDIDHRVDMVASDTESFSRDVPQYMHYLLKYDELFSKKIRNMKKIGGKLENGISLYRPPEVFENELFPDRGEDLFFLDLSGKNNPESYRAMEEADVVVVMLPLHKDELKEYFSRFPVTRKKTYYVFNGYSTRSETSPNGMRTYLQENYRVKKGTVCFIPYYENMKRACHLGEVDKMMEAEAEKAVQSSYYCQVKDLGRKIIRYKIRVKL